MLKGIDPIITGDLLKALCDMGHGDTIAIVDANYPAHTMNEKVMMFSGLNATEVLTAVLSLMPLDHIVDSPALIMDLEQRDMERGLGKPEIWGEFDSIISGNHGKKIARVSRQDFYEMSKKASVVIQTGESRLYGNVILVKGVL